mmetsp:Transcript_31558/g.69075  ORF Transcript_31558/g.69075 Transcript_31558/m.69075 type:complete len:209 (-) Transcript_31558:1846-2472(-)
MYSSALGCPRIGFSASFFSAAFCLFTNLGTSLSLIFMSETGSSNGGPDFARVGCAKILSRSCTPIRLPSGARKSMLGRLARILLDSCTKSILAVMTCPEATLSFLTGAGYPASKVPGSHLTNTSNTQDILCFPSTSDSLVLTLVALTRNPHPHSMASDVSLRYNSRPTLRNGPKFVGSLVMARRRALTSSSSHWATHISATASLGSNE